MEIDARIENFVNPDRLKELCLLVGKPNKDGWCLTDLKWHTTPQLTDQPSSVQGFATFKRLKGLSERGKS